jgi:3-deoxy-D-manno-octulosonate 8-phosphate phosphatase (KDO 8-P phosphatase)
VVTLAPNELRARAARLRLVVTDCDGVLTDGGVYYSERGEELKRFSIRDGMGFERLRKAGLRVAIMTGERSGSVARRAEKLAALAYLGVGDKTARLDEAIAELALAGLCEVAYVGDDVNDLVVMQRVAAAGLTGAPADAIAEVRALAHHQCEASGGDGAFREFAEWVIALRSGGA